MREPTDARLNMRLPSRLKRELQQEHRKTAPEMKFHAWLRAIWEGFLDYQPKRKDEPR